MIVYEPLWKTMKEKKVSQYLLIKTYGISCGQLDRLKKKSVCVHSHDRRSLYYPELRRGGRAGIPDG